MEGKIGCGIFGDSSPQPNSRYGVFLDSSGSAEENRSVRRRRTSSGLNEDDDFIRDFQRQQQQNIDDILASTDKSFSRRLQNLQSTSGLFQTGVPDVGGFLSPLSNGNNSFDKRTEGVDVNKNYVAASAAEQNLKESFLRVKVEVTDIFYSPGAKGSDSALKTEDLGNDDLERDERVQLMNDIANVETKSIVVDTQNEYNNIQAESTEDFKQHFLNNHIPTILEDFDGENVASEFSLTQRTIQERQDEQFVEMTPSRSSRVDQLNISVEQSAKSSQQSIDFFCTEFVDFGKVYLGQTVSRVIKATPGIILESELQQIVYFEGMKQELCVDATGQAKVFLQANRLGFQEKYISAIGKTGEIDIKLKVEVLQAPELMCARTNLVVRKAGVYKIPIKLTNYAESSEDLQDFDLQLKETIPGIYLRKQTISLKDGTTKAILLAVAEPLLLDNIKLEVQAICKNLNIGFSVMVRINSS